MVPVDSQKYIRVLIFKIFFPYLFSCQIWLNLPIDVHQLGYIINCDLFGELFLVFFQKKKKGNRFIVLVRIRVFLPHLKKEIPEFLYRKIGKKTLIINLTKKQTTEMTGGSVQIKF